MFLHDLKLSFLSVSNHLLNDVFDGLDEILESHLIGVGFIPHYFYENEVVVIFGDFLIGHTSKIG